MSQQPARGPTNIPPIWVISLARSSERRVRIAKHLDDLGLNYEFVDAIDGRTMPPEECARSVDAKKLRRLLGRQLLPVEIACALSHRKLYQRQVDEGLAEVIIFEDDAEPTPEFVEVLALKNRLPRDWELLYFHRRRFTRMSVWGRRRLGRWLCMKFGSLAFGTVAYMLRQSGARKLLAHSFPVCAPADWLTGGAVRAGVRLYGIFPPCVNESVADPDASTMPEARAIHQKTPEQLKRTWVTFHLERLKYRIIHTNERYNPFCIK